MIELLESKLAKDELQSDKMVEEAEKLVAEVANVCQDFESMIGPILRIAARFRFRTGIRLNSRQTKRDEWQLYRDACSSVTSKVDNREAINRVVESHYELWQKAADRFKKFYPRDWLLIGEWNGHFRELPSGTPRERGQRAMERMLEKGLPKGWKQEASQKVSKQDIIHAMESACRSFVIDLWHMWERPSKVKGSQSDAHQLLNDYKEVCGEFVTDQGDPYVIKKQRKRTSGLSS